MHWRTGNSIALCLLAFITSALAADGDYDTSFGVGGRERVDVSPPGSWAQAMVLRNDRRIVLAGFCGDNGFAMTVCLARLLPDGSPDPGFGTGGSGYATFNDFGAAAGNAFTGILGDVDIRSLADGRIVVMANTYMGNPTYAVRLAIVKENGSALDPSTGNGSGFLMMPVNERCGDGKRLLVQADGKFIVICRGLSDTGDYDISVTRVKADLSGLDSPFGVGGTRLIPFNLDGGGGANEDYGVSGALRNDGSMVVLGNARKGSIYEVALTRLLADGSIDNSFGSTGNGRVHYSVNGWSTLVRPLVLDHRDRIVIGGSVEQWSFVDRRNADGSRDDTFNLGTPNLFQPLPGIPTSYVYALLAEFDGIFAVGYSSRSVVPGNNWFTIVRLTSSGRVDLKFGTDGRSYGTFAPAPSLGTDDYGFASAIDKGSVLVAGGSVDGPANKTFAGIARLQYDRIFVGSFD